jgi:TolB-like protein
MSSIVEELRRRNVFRVGIAYLAAAWLILQVVDLVLENTQAPPWVMQLLLTLFAIGFPIALIFSWAYEITPEGMKREKDVDRSQSITRQTGRRLDRVIIVILALAVVVLVAERSLVDDVAVPTAVTADTPTEDTVEAPPAEVTGTGRRSIAVLPFLNMSSDQEQQWFADGLTEEILNSLAKAPDLLVASRTSSFNYKGSDLSITDIAAEMGVDHVLEGSVRRGGETLRITAQLIRAADGFHLWSETFDRTFNDIISIQEEIAFQIASALDTAMDPEALAEMMDVGTASVAAYDAYLTGIGAWGEYREAGDPFMLLKAKEEYERAVEIDPGFSSAYYELFDFWNLQALSNTLVTGVTELPRDEIMANRDKYLDLAIETTDDETQLIAYEASKAGIQLNFRAEYRLWREYVTARPGAELPWSYWLIASARLGMRAEQVAPIRERFESREVSEVIANTMMQNLRDPDSLELLREIAKTAVEKFGGQVAVMYQAHRALLWSGDFDGASRLLPALEASQLPENSRVLVRLRQACADLRIGDAEQLLNYGLERFPDELSFQYLGRQAFGDSDGAHAVFVPYDEARDFDTIADYLTYPHFDPTRFPNFMERFAAQRYEERELHDIPFRCNR